MKFISNLPHHVHPSRFRRVLFLSVAVFLSLTSAWVSAIPTPAQARASDSSAKAPLIAPNAPKSGTVSNCSNQTDLESKLAGGGTVTFSCSGTIPITSTLFITAPTTIDGGGQITLDGGNAGRIITTTAGVGTLTLQNITLTKGFVNNVTANNNGGALFVRGALVLSNTTLVSNTAYMGGGAYITGTLTMTNSKFISNTASLEGGGARVSGAAALYGGLFQNNRATITPSYGGGLSAQSNLTLTGTQFISNTAYIAGGVRVLGVVNMNGGLFQNNRSTAGSGGGLDAEGTVLLTDTHFLSNTAGFEGGGARVNGAATLNGGLFQNNINTFRGGGLYVGSTLALTGTQFISNNAYTGGGVYHRSGAARIVNALFARNRASFVLGASLYLASTGDVQILHTTIASPTLASGSAIYIAGGTVGITNTIIASHTVGISNTAGTVYENYNLFFGNTTNKSGTISGGANDIVGSNPNFVNQTVDNYHLQLTSPSINAGTNAGVATDVDGQTRPVNILFDIGYDEYPFVILRLFLPLIMR